MLGGVLVQTWVSQTQRTLEVWRYLCKSSIPASSLKQVQLDQVAQQLVQLSCEYLQSWRSHSFLGHSSSGWLPTRWVFFFYNLVRIPLLQCVFIASCPLADHPQEECQSPPFHILRNMSLEPYRNVWGYSQLIITDQPFRWGDGWVALATHSGFAWGHFHTLPTDDGSHQKAKSSVKIQPSQNILYSVLV